MYKNSQQKDFLLGALMGATIATLTAVLFNTNKGKQLQQQIENAYDEVKDAVKGTFFKAKDKAGQAADHIKDSVDQGTKKMGIQPNKDDAPE